MTATPTTTTSRAEFSADQIRHVIDAYMGDAYTEEETDFIIPAITAALTAAVNELLPENVSWTPGGGFIHPADFDLDDLDLNQVFDDAWAGINERMVDIETAAVAPLAALRQADEADRRRRRAEFDVKIAALERALHLADAARLMGGQDAVAAWLGVSRPAVSQAVAKIPPKRTFDQFDMVRVTAEMIAEGADPEYKPDTEGTLSLRIGGRHYLWVPDITRAMTWVALECRTNPRDVRLVGDGPWTVREV